METKEELDYKSAWAMALKILKENMSPSTFTPWVEPLVPAVKGDEQYKENAFVLKSHHAFGVSHLKKNFLSEIQKTIDEIIPSKPSVEIVFVPNDVKKPSKKKKQPEHISLMQEQIDNLKQMQSFCALNLKYTFENFVNGENSNVAYNAAKMVADAPGQKFNPLFVTGTTGLGKTHLMQAIGHQILKNFPSLKVKYVKAEEFTNRLVESCRNGLDSFSTMKKFRDQYRNVDVLLLDDIQFAEGKKRTEEEIFHTFDALFNQGKQIVFASDKPIEDFEKTPDRLKGRYEWGLSVEIKPPSLDTRYEIIKKHSVRSNFEISDEVAMLLAKHYSKNIRELEGAYNKVSAYASIQGIELNVQNTKEILGLNDKKSLITVDGIINECAKFYNIQPDFIKGSQRSSEIKEARQIAIYLSREILDLSFPSLAKSFNKNHTTIMYSHDKIQKDIITNKELKDKIAKIKDIILNQ